MPFLFKGVIKMKNAVANIIIKSIFFICVTVAAIFFNNAHLLWWYILGLAIECSYFNKENKTIKGV